MAYEKAAENACNALKIAKQEKVVIITDVAKEFFAKVLAEEIIKRGASLDYFVIEDYGTRPYALPGNILNSFEKADAGFIMNDQIKGEYAIFKKPLLDMPEKNKKLRLATMPGISREMLDDSMLADFDKVDEFSQKVYDFISTGKKLKIKTEKGTNLTALVGKYNWVKSTGLIKPGTWGNIPSGEVYTTPYSISGNVVVDGTVCGSINQDAYQNPVKMIIQDSKIMWVHCKDKDLEQKILKDINTDENASVIGELAFGTNIFIKRLIGHGLQDEKYPGVHFANGDPIGEKTGAKWESKTHTDHIITRANVWLDGKQLMENGKYLIK